jgi:hypothetical protein
MFGFPIVDVWEAEIPDYPGSSVRLTRRLPRPFREA